MNNFNMNIYSKGMQNVDITDDEFRKLINSDNVEEHMDIKGAKSILSILLTFSLGIGFILSSNFILESISIIGFAYMLIFQCRPSVKYIINHYNERMSNEYGIDVFSNQIETKERKRIEDYKNAVKEINYIVDILNEPIVIDGNKVSRLYKHLNIMESDIHTLTFNLDEDNFGFISLTRDEQFKEVDKYELEAINYVANQIKEIDSNKIINIIDALKRENERQEMEKELKRKREAYSKFTLYEQNEKPDIEQSLEDYSERLNQTAIEQAKQLEQAWLDNQNVMANIGQEKVGE